VEKGIAQSKLGFNGNRIILSVGRIIALKGIDRLLVAMTYLEERGRLKLVVIGGDGHCYHELERLKVLSRNLGIHKSVNFLGLVEQGKLSYFYSAADLCVVPYT
jgi:glycosyltransferase involved in cell wall biosynthesis